MGVGVDVQSDTRLQLVRLFLGVPGGIADALPLEEVIDVVPSALRVLVGSHRDFPALPWRRDLGVGAFGPNSRCRTYADSGTYIASASTTSRRYSSGRSRIESNVVRPSAAFFMSELYDVVINCQPESGASPTTTFQDDSRPTKSPLLHEESERSNSPPSPPPGSGVEGGGGGWSYGVPNATYF